MPLESETIPKIGHINSTWAPIPYRISEKQVEIDGLLTFQLEPAGPERIDTISPGQFNMLYAFGIGEIPISVSSGRSSPSSLIHTIQDVGPVSKALCQRSLGEMIGVRGPFGTSWPIECAKGKDVLNIAGGVGLCPLRPVIEHVLNHRDQHGKLNVLLGTRNPEMIFYHRDIIFWESDPSLNFHLTVDHAFSNWRGNVGVVTNLMDHATYDPESTVAFLCGPEVMMRFGIYACIDAGIREENIYLSMERNMKCAVGFCGHCQLGPYFMCKDGAVFPYSKMKPYLNVNEL